MKKLAKTRLHAACTALCAALCTLALAGCGSTTDDTTLHVMTLKGPTSIGMTHMMADAAEQENSLYEFTMAGAPDEVVSAVASGSVDLAVVPTNLAAVLYNKTEGGVQMLAVNAFGSLYLLECSDASASQSDPITKFSQLAGKTIYATGQGANPQFVLEYLLEQAGLTIGEDVKVIYLSEHEELASKIAAGDVEFALLPEPFATTVMNKNGSVRVAIDLNDAWNDATGGKLTMGCVIARTEFTEEHPAAVKHVLTELEDSIENSFDDVDATAQLCVDFEIVPDVELAKKVVPRCSIGFLAGEDMRKPVESFLSVLHKADPASVGGALPADDFYWMG